MEDCAKEGITYYELPVAFDALTVVVNPKSKITQLSVAQLKKMWEPDAQGKVSNWNQVDLSFPGCAAQPLRCGFRLRYVRLLHRGHQRQVQASQGDYTASEDDNVLVQGVSRDVNARSATSATPTTPRTRAKLKAVAIVNAKGEAACRPRRA